MTGLHIGIDGNEANVEKRVGSNWYAYELLKALYSANRQTVKPSNRYTIYLKYNPLPDMPQANDYWHYRVLKPTKAWTQWRLPLSLYLNPNRPNVFFSPGHYSPRFSPVPTIATILDLAYLEYPNLFLTGERGFLQLKTWTDYSVKNSCRLITISQSTKNDIVKHFHYPDNKITVAYPGVNATHFSRESDAVVNKVLAKLAITRPYLLYVGTLQPRKNLERLVEAFENLPPKYKQYQLIIAGGKGWKMERFHTKVQNSKANSRIKLLGYVSNVDLPALYSGARALILIGLYEGFGIPPAEALACGTLPVISNTTSLPEVIGPGGGILVDPFSQTSIRHGIITALDLTPEAYRERVDNGRKHISQFTWDKAAQSVLKTIYDLTFQR
jgi:glycosyltransferase involved in cell wall biosynthesis